jgi:Mg-chelatase subunit ChlD
MRTSLLLVSVFAALMSACNAADLSLGSGGNGTPPNQGTAGSASVSTGGPSGGSGSPSGGSGGNYAGADATSWGGGSGGAPATDEGGIGLKPGGAQDIAFFRTLIANGQLPKPGDMTIEGWLNEHDTVLPPAKPDRVVTLHALAAVLQPKPEQPAEAYLQLGLNSAQSLASVQAPVGLVVVIDRSGSMAGDNKMAAVKAGLHALVKAAPASTALGLVSFSSGVSVDVAPALLAAGQQVKLDQAIDALWPDGGTNIAGGLEAGIAQCQGAPGKFKRILLLSDGQATEGHTDPGYIEGLAVKAKAAGCSVSTVGVGMDFDAQLMLKVAQKGNGTAWFVQDATHAEAAFVQDLATMVLPVAQDLKIQFKLAAGWQVKQIFGFEWVQQGDVVTLGGQKQTAPNTPDGPQPPVEQGGQVPMPTLFASKKNGLVMVQLQGPAGYDVTAAQQLKLATVQYGYTIAKQGQTEQFEVPVEVPGVVAVPDQGPVYFASPVVRRAWLLLATGQDLIAAVQAAHGGQPQVAQAVLSGAHARIATQIQGFGAELAAVDSATPDLADAKLLVEQVWALVP